MLSRPTPRLFPMPSTSANVMAGHSSLSFNSTYGSLSRMARQSFAWCSAMYARNFAETPGQSLINTTSISSSQTRPRISSRIAWDRLGILSRQAGSSLILSRQSSPRVSIISMARFRPTPLNRSLLKYAIRDVRSFAGRTREIRNVLIGSRYVSIPENAPVSSSFCFSCTYISA